MSRTIKSVCTPESARPWPRNRFRFGLRAKQCGHLSALTFNCCRDCADAAELTSYSSTVHRSLWRPDKKLCYVLAKDDATDVTFSANKPPFPRPPPPPPPPPPLPPPPVPDNKLHSCIFGKWQSGRSQKKKKKTQSKKTVCSLDFCERGSG